MFDLWKLQRDRRHTVKLYEKAIAECKADKAKTRDDLEALYAEEGYEIQMADDALDTFVSDRLLEEARELDIETPRFNETDGLWEKNFYHNRVLLSAKGRAAVRKLIHEEKTRRFEIKVRWVKLLLPLVTALAGLAGVITGLVVALKK